MDQNLQNVTVEAVKTLTEWAKQGGDFVKDQAPLLAKEIINSGYISSLFFIFVSIIVIIPICLVHRKWSWKEADENCGASPMLTKFFSGIGVVVCFVFLSANLYSLFFIYFCPRLYILKYVSYLVK